MKEISKKGRFKDNDALKKRAKAMPIIIFIKVNKAFELVSEQHTRNYAINVYGKCTVLLKDMQRKNNEEEE